MGKKPLRNDSDTQILTLPADVKYLEKVLELLNERLDETSCPEDIRLALNIATEEIYVNIASYAYAPKQGDARLAFTLEKDPEALSIEFIDKGVPYNPLAKENPDITLSAEDRQIGGLGIYMVKKSMDSLSYDYRNGENHCTIKKYLSPLKKQR